MTQPCLSPCGVIFDMDGVLVDSAAPHLRSWQLLAAENGREVTPERFAATFGGRNAEIIPLLFGEVTPVRLQALSERKELLYRELIRGQVPIVPGARELVRDLHAAGVRLAVGSSGPRENIELALRALQAEGMILTIVSADDVTRGKPDPQVFTLACERLQLPPRCCVVVEDAPSGVRAARAAGAKSVAVLRHHPPEAFDRPDGIVSRLADLSVDGLLSLARA